MFAVILNDKVFFDGFNSLEEARIFALKLGKGIPDFKSVKVVEVKD